MKIYLSEQVKSKNIKLFKKHFPSAKIILKKNYFVNDDDYLFFAEEKDKNTVATHIKKDKIKMGLYIENLKKVREIYKKCEATDLGPTIDEMSIIKDYHKKYGFTKDEMLDDFIKRCVRSVLPKNIFNEPIKKTNKKS